MKRPQSAKQNRNFWAQHSSDEGYGDGQSRGYAKSSKTHLNAVSTSNDISRLLPRRIPHDKERLYFETMQLKTSLNEVSQQNHRLKTKVAVLQKQKQKTYRIEEIGLRRGGKSGLLSGAAQKQNAIIVNLKRLVRQSKEQSENTKIELAKIKKNIRYTKINQLQMQRQTVYEQNRELSKLLIQLQNQLKERDQDEDHFEEMAIQLKNKKEELKQLAEDNRRYEQIMEQYQMKNRELTQKIASVEKKMQRDLAVEKRKVDQLNRMNDNLKSTNKALTQKMQEQKKKPIKKLIRPVSSNSYKNQLRVSQPAEGYQSIKQKAVALQLNQKLKKELLEAKKKLAISENQLTKQEPKLKPPAASYYDQSFELQLTKNEPEQFLSRNEPKNKKQSEVVKKERPQSKKQEKVQSKKKHNSAVPQQLKQILTYRMRYNRYTFDQLRQDIEASPLQIFTVRDLMTMLTEEPFYLTQAYSIQFLKLCIGQGKWSLSHQVSAETLLINMKKCLAEYSLLDEKEEEQMLYQIADFMTQHRVALERQFQRLRATNNLATKNQLQNVLRKFKGLSQAQIDLAICYASATCESLSKINYQDLLDKFLMNNNSIQSSGRAVKEQKDEQDLSLGENEQIPSAGEDEEDQLI